MNDNINAWNDHNNKSVDPVRATISIVPLLPFQELRRLAFTAQKRAGHPYWHVSGGSGGGPSCPIFPKGFTALYRSTIIHGLTTRWASCLDVLFLIQFIFYIFIFIFDDPSVLMVHIFYLISFVVCYTIIISIMCIFLYYHTWDYIFHLASFFYHHIIVFSRVLLYTICLFFVPVRSVCWSKNIYANYIMIYLQSFVLIFDLLI